MCVLVIGDSIVGGFGKTVRKDSFVHKALKKQSITYEDVSCSGMTIEMALNYFENGIRRCAEQPDNINVDDIECVIISLGNVDGKKIIRKNNTFSTIIPSRYQGFSGFIDERPYYSSKMSRYIMEWIENKVRFFFKLYAQKTNNLDFPQDINHSLLCYKKILDIFDDKKIVIVSTSVISNTLFPNSEEYFANLNAFFKNIKNNQKKIFFFDIQKNIDVNDVLLDKFHLTREAHNKMADIFENFIVSNVKI